MPHSLANSMATALGDKAVYCPWCEQDPFLEAGGEFIV